MATMARSAMFSLGASFLAGGILIARAGTHVVMADIVPFLFWTLPFALAMAISSLLATTLFSRLHSLWNYGLAVIIGTIAAWLWGICLYSLFINPYFGTFAFPVGFAWSAGGISGLIAVAGTGSPAKKGNLATELALTVLVCFGLAFGRDELIVRLYDERQADIVWIKWKPGQEQLVLDKRLRDYLTDEEQTHLLAMNLGGRLTWKGTGGQGQLGPKSRMVIIMQQQLTEAIRLHLPERWVIYVQEKNGWRKEPPDAAIVTKSLGLEIDTNVPQWTNFVWEDRWGISRSGGFDWSQSDP